jgi:hypothetical protein
MKLLIFKISVFISLNGFCQSNAEFIYNENTIDTIIWEINNELPSNRQLSDSLMNLIKVGMKNELEQIQILNSYLLNANYNSLRYYNENFSAIMGKCQTDNDVIDSFYDKVIPHLKSIVQRRFTEILKENLIAKESVLLSASSLNKNIARDTISAASKECDIELLRKVDDFNGQVMITTSIRNWNWDRISFSKFIEKKSVKYYLSIDVKTQDNYYGKGVFFILKNGKRIDRPNQKVESDYSDGNFFSTAFITLTSQDMKLFSESGIEKYKVDFLTGNFIEQSNVLREMASCILNAK